MRKKKAKSRKLPPWRKRWNAVQRTKRRLRDKIAAVCKKHNVHMLIHYQKHPFTDLPLTTTGMEYRQDEMAVGKKGIVLYWGAQSIERGELAIAELLMQYDKVVVIHNMNKDI
jgi:hypothetical protein